MGEVRPVLRPPPREGLYGKDVAGEAPCQRWRLNIKLPSVGSLRGGGVVSEVWLEIPIDDVETPRITILVPAMNEQETIGTFISWCHEGLAEAGVPGEIVIVDSSTDDTPNVAVAGGARVVHTEPKGLGAAYIEGIKWIRGDFVILGDADCTYDFRKLSEFLAAWQAGNTFVMGSRFKGSIEPGAMPKLHQYFGTPVTTWMLNRIFGSDFSDIHCGMRGVDAETLRAMSISSPSWQYASEMIIKSVEMELPTAEVPINFYADRGDRESHMKRKGRLEPFRAGWQNVKAMLTYGAPYFLLRPGQAVFLLGLILFTALALGPIDIGSVEFSSTTQLVGAFLILLGLQMVLLARVAQGVTDYRGVRRATLSSRYDLNRMLKLCSMMCIVGALFLVPVLSYYVNNGLRLDALASWEASAAIGGITLVIASFCIFTAALVIQIVNTRFQELSAEIRVSEISSRPVA